MHITNKPSSGFGYVTPNMPLPESALVTVSGVMPLTITAAKATAPYSISIHGNTLNTVGVGDRTENLFDKTKFISPIAPSSSAKRFEASQHNVQYNTRIYYIPAQPNTTYIFSKEIGDNLYICSCPAIPCVGGTITNISLTGTITTSSNDHYIAIYPLYIDDLSNGLTYNEVEQSIMINKGESVASYEPYGYKIPLVIASAHSVIHHNIYIDAPVCDPTESIIINPEQQSVQRLSDSEIIDLSERNATLFPKLFKGKNIITANTLTPCSSIIISYFV